MKQILPWNVTGIPPEAREMARSAAARDGLSVGDWLTRRIYIESQQEMQEQRAEPGSSNSRNVRSEETLQGRDEIMHQLACMEGATESAFRRIDETLQSLGRRLETPENSQNVAKPSTHNAASEIDGASRARAQEFSQLARRVENIERTADSAPLRKAVHGLHQCVSRLAEQVARSETSSLTRIDTLTRNIDCVTKAGQVARVESGQLAKDLGERLNALTEKIARSEERLGGLEDHVQEELGHHTSSFERKFADISERLDQAQRIQGGQESSREEALESIKERLSATERRNQEAYSEFRLSLEEMRRRLDSANLQPELEDKHDVPATDDKSRSPLPGMHDDFVPREENPPVTNAAQKFLSVAPQSTNPASEAQLAAGRSDLANTRPNRKRELQEKVGVDLRRALPVISLGLLLATGVGYLILSSGLLPFRDGFGSAQGGLAPTTAYAAESDTLAPRSNTGLFSPLDSGLAPQTSIATTTLLPISEAPAEKSFPASSARSRSAAEQVAEALSLAGPAPSTPRIAGPESLSPAQPLYSAARGDLAAAALPYGQQNLEEGALHAAEDTGGRWLQTAAEQGEPAAQYRLGSIYGQGLGIPADPGQATFWYEQAAHRGHRTAMHNLAVAYANGIGIEKNLAEASRWFRSAADLGLTDSQFNLAVVYERGMGVPISLNEAYKWYLIAAVQGDTEAQTRAELLAMQLSEEQRLTAERAATNYAPQQFSRAANELPTLAQLQ